MSPHKPVLTMDELRDLAKGTDNIAEWARVELVRREAQAKVGRANKRYTEAERIAARKESQRKWREKKRNG